MGDATGWGYCRLIPGFLEIEGNHIYGGAPGVEKDQSLYIPDTLEMLVDLHALVLKNFSSFGRNEENFNSALLRDDVFFLYN